MKIYLAARYSRRLELCKYRYELQNAGHVVTSRWLNGTHQITADGSSLGAAAEAATLRRSFAAEDFLDVVAARMIISFTEPPGTCTRGGRHVEHGIAAAAGLRLIIIGYRENIFHWAGAVEFFPTWRDCTRILGLVHPTSDP